MLCKEIDPEILAFTMDTDIDRWKGLALRAGPRCAIVSHWASRQARIEGEANTDGRRSM